MKRILTPLILAATLSFMGAAHAEPYCTELNIKEQLPKKFQKRGPFYSDSTSGWIIGHDQLKTGFEVTEEVIALWQSIASEFRNHGAELVVLAAPPRPLFAPSAARSEMNLPDDFSLASLKNEFSTYIAGLNQAGIIAPDLSALAAGETAGDYYFARDTHWTPIGAAVSVAQLKEAIDQTPTKESLAGIEFTQHYDEKGSLAAVVDATCGTRPVKETVSAPVYAVQGSAASLLADTPESGAIALVGTSFSDRYQRDAYQVAGALSVTMDAPVDNYSVTGGGLVGAMEAFIQTGVLQDQRYETIVWEAPYSAPLTQVDGLRQILGALQSQTWDAPIDQVNAQISDDWISIKRSFSTTDVARLEIETDQTTIGQVYVELVDSAGQKTRTKLVKTDRIASVLRSTQWAIALEKMAANDIKRIKLRLKGATAQEPVTIRFFN